MPFLDMQVLYLAAPPPLRINLSDPEDIDRVTLTNLRIRLIRHNFPPGADAMSVFFAVYNLEVWGWCFCNGHSGPCQPSQEEQATEGMVSGDVL